MHVLGRTPGTRIEQTLSASSRTLENLINRDIGKDQIDTLLDIIGIPNSGINLSLSDGSLMSPADGEVLVSLKKGHRSTELYKDQLARDMRAKFPDLTFYFAPADIVTQVLNFGIAAPIDVQIEGSKADEPTNLLTARRIAKEVAGLPARLGRAPRAGAGRSEAAHERGPHPGELFGADAARRGQRHADLAQRHRAAEPQLLGGPQEFGPVRRPRADPAVPDRLGQRPPQPAGPALLRRRPGRRL